jgi:hypothetical protein
MERRIMAPRLLRKNSRAPPSVLFSAIPGSGGQKPPQAPRRCFDGPPKRGATTAESEITGDVVDKVRKAESWRPDRQESENSNIVDQRAGQAAGSAKDRAKATAAACPGSGDSTSWCPKSRDDTPEDS